ncbi:MAG: hypothetical protein JO206_14465 [Solirubrobacterales bacterium]|nr:hypothetical protein [Solirubrobacterales bacterium]MBV9474167.1 hypothetical protein [Solirubrobacterales bacterium]MBV9839134.1 hypothetical protein [Solirubrobacterales bacterium]
MRILVLTIALLFIVLLGALTVSDFVRYGVTALGVLSILVVAVFTIGVVGALRHPPRQ